MIITAKSSEIPGVIDLIQSMVPGLNLSEYKDRLKGVGASGTMTLTKEMPLASDPTKNEVVTITVNMS